MPASDQHSSDHNNRVKTGRKYEQLAARFFEDKGFLIRDKNWHAGSREIDLIVQKDDLIVFVEVKSTRSRQYGHPVERVDKRKVANLVKAAQKYLIENNIHDCNLQFDIITFTNGQLEHFPNAFPAEE